jgi:hypothetical protein
MAARQSAKATPFAGGNEADGLKKAPRRLFSNVPDRQKPRLLPAATKLMA